MKRSALLGLCAFLFPSIAWADTGTFDDFWDVIGTAVRLSEGQTGTPQHPSIALGRRDQPYVVWSSSTTGNAEIYLRRWRFPEWKGLGESYEPGGISQSAGASRSPVVVVDADERVTVAWQETAPGGKEIYLRRWSGATWEALGGSASNGGVSNSSTASLAPAMVLDPQGNPIVAWREKLSDSSDEIRVRRWNGEQWESLGDFPTQIPPGQPPAGPSLAVNETGLLALAWPAGNEESGGSVYLLLRDPVTAVWEEFGGSGSGEVNGTGSTAQYVSVALSSVGDPVLAWGGAGPQWQQGVFAKSWNSGSQEWSSFGGNDRVGSTVNFVHPQVALAADNVPVVAFSDWWDGGVLVLQWSSDSGWQPIDASDDPFYMSMPQESPALRIDSQGMPVFAWAEENNVRFVRRHHTGDPSERIDIVCVPRWFSEAELPVFLEVCRQGYEGFRVVSPLNRHLELFNFRWTSGEAAEAPDVDEIFTVVNADGRSNASIGGSATIYRNQPWAFVHEAGHSFAWAVHDEYYPWAGGTYVGPEPDAPNLTASLSSPLKWEEWLDDPPPPMPTPMFHYFPVGSTRVGAYEGGGGLYAHGIYHPADSCMMISASGAFCPVCAQAIARSIYEYDDIGSIEATPSDLWIGASPEGTVLSIALVGPYYDDDISINWYVDGALAAQGVLSFTLPPRPAGVAHVRVVISQEASSLVRVDPEGSLSRAIEWYVSSSGSASVFRVPEDYPSIGDAVAAVPDGAEIHIAPGVYHENLSLREKSLTLRGLEGAGSTILDGDGVSAVVEVINFSESIQVFEGLTVRNGGVGGINIASSGGVVFRRCQIVDNHRQNGPGALAFSNGGDLHIENSLIARNHGSTTYGAIFVIWSSLKFINNTLADNVGGGIYLYRGGSHIFRNNIVVRNGSWGLRVELTSLAAAYSDVWGHTNNLTGGGAVAGTGYLSVDPGFAETETYRLNWRSPCVDAGDPLDPYDQEPFGGGGRINQGAYGNTPEAEGRVRVPVFTQAVAAD